MYSETLLDHFQNPRRVGWLGPPAISVQVENPICGDIMTLSAEVSDGAIRDIRFRVRGCTASIAAGSALTGLLLGRRVEDVHDVDPGLVESAVNGLPSESKHAARLASDAAKALATRLTASSRGAL